MTGGSLVALAHPGAPGQAQAQKRAAQVAWRLSGSQE
jgi:hypothetical protein